MAIITNPDATNELLEIANQSINGIDTNRFVAILNKYLPPNQQLAQGVGVTIGVYKQFGIFDVIKSANEVVTTGLWSGDVGSLTTFFTSSAQTSSISGKYYWNVYNTNPQSDEGAEVQFAVAYGHIFASGSPSISSDDDSTLETKATYAQYRSLLLSPNDTKFSFTNNVGGVTDSDDIFVINVGRARFREKMDAQNWSLTLSGSNGEFIFIDDSGKKFNDEDGKAGSVFNVVEGDLEIGTESPATITSTTASNGLGYGLFYPDHGIIILNPAALVSKVGSPIVQASSNTTSQAIHQHLFTAIKNGADFEARRTENIATEHFFVRATNREFNYSNNPTFVTTTGAFTEKSFEIDPHTYITTVGLYNDSNELIAVAKTSQPIAKSFSRELLIKVKIDF